MYGQQQRDQVLAGMVEGGRVGTTSAGSRGRTPGLPDSMVGTGKWTIRVMGRWQGHTRAQESETRALLEKVARRAAKWTREPLRNWMSRREDWRERAEECLIRAERAWGSGKEGEAQETGEALAKVRQALRTLVDIERQLNGYVIATDRWRKERWTR